ncbi:hypothetical protein OIU83_01465 [Flavobacterium sp. LS1R49]|uniref:Uncharacterized protein n=1 Tax=Flavobacterium shii TaxID=2987687 RepID=A0A9X2Z961_9FLAO|nr:hypothetical protein [Flavobacterium shii]MCV9926304.1 hypothetical protein [Flavobacterium shii]
MNIRIWNYSLFSDCKELMLNDKITERMFTNISWTHYIVVIVLLVASWYLFVGLRFYVNDIKEIVTGKRKRPMGELGDTNSYESQAMLNSQEALQTNAAQSSFGEFDSTFQQVDGLVERLKSVIANAAKRKLLKQEFMDYLRLVLAEYPTIKNSSFSPSVSELIVSECDKLDAVTLSQEEAEGLWN